VSWKRKSKAKVQSTTFLIFSFITIVDLSCFVAMIILQLLVIVCVFCHIRGEYHIRFSYFNTYPEYLLIKLLRNYQCNL